MTDMLDRLSRWLDERRYRREVMEANRRYEAALRRTEKETR